MRRPGSEQQADEPHSCSQSQAHGLSLLQGPERSTQSRSWAVLTLFLDTSLDLNPQLLKPTQGTTVKQLPRKTLPVADPGFQDTPGSHENEMGASHGQDCSRHARFRHRHPRSLFWVTMTLECAHCRSSGSEECPGHLGGDQTCHHLSHACPPLSMQKALSPSGPLEGPRSQIKACARGVVWLPGGGNVHLGARAATVCCPPGTRQRKPLMQSGQRGGASWELGEGPCSGSSPCLRP